MNDSQKNDIEQDIHFQTMARDYHAASAQYWERRGNNEGRRAHDRHRREAQSSLITLAGAKPDDQYAMVTFTECGRRALRRYLSESLGPGRFLLNACTTECLSALESCLDEGKPMVWQVTESAQPFWPEIHHVNIEWGSEP